MKTANQRALEAVQMKREEIRQKSTAILEKQSEDDDRQLTDEETKELAQYVKDMKTLDEQEGDFKEAVRVEQEVLGLSRDLRSKEPLTLPNGIDDVQVRGEHKSIGQLFTDSAAYKSIRDPATRPGVFTTGPVELSTKGTLLEGAGSPGSGTGGGLLPVPQVQPGVVDKLFQRLTVADLLPSGTVAGNSLRYIVEGTATSGAAGVAEGGVKPESTLGLSTVDEPTKKVATSLTVSDEMLEDGPAVESYINSRLSLFVQIEEERQILLGGGTNELVGIIGRSGVNTYARGTVDTYAEALFKALNGTRGSSLLEPDGMILNPADWQVIRLMKDANNQYFGGGPFVGQYGAGPNIGASGQVTGAMDTIWNKPVVVTSAIGVGTALLGAFGSGAQLFRRGGLSVEASNSHSDYFEKNLVKIRAEQRELLAVYRPGSFTKVTF